MFGKISPLNPMFISLVYLDLCLTYLKFQFTLENWKILELEKPFSPHPLYSLPMHPFALIITLQKSSADMIKYTYI